MTLLSLTGTILSVILFQSAIHHEALATCYFPDGTKADSSFQPCKPSEPESACCATNKTNGAPNDICLDNGLCYSQDSEYSGLIFQSSCTKQSWGTSACPKYCPVGGSNDGYFVLPCPGSGKSYWCCSDSGNDCCSGGAFSLSMPALLPSTTTSSSSLTSTSSTSTSSTSTTSATRPATTTDSGEDAQCDEDSTSTAVGAGLGVALAVCFIGALAGLYFQRRMYRRQLQEHKERLAVQYIPTPTYNSPVNLYPPPAELNSTGKAAVYELGETRRESRQRF